MEPTLIGLSLEHWRFVYVVVVIRRVLYAWIAVSVVAAGGSGGGGAAAADTSSPGTVVIAMKSFASSKIIGDQPTQDEAGGGRQPTAPDYDPDCPVWVPPLPVSQSSPTTRNSNGSSSAPGGGSCTCDRVLRDIRCEGLSAVPLFTGPPAGLGPETGSSNGRYDGFDRRHG